MTQLQTSTIVPFSVPYVAGAEGENLQRVINSDHTQGDGDFTRASTEKIQQLTGADAVLLTTSCSHALDMSMMLMNIGPGDEVILPSFTFPSAANSVALRGATVVFVDCDQATGNIDVEQAISACTDRTRAIVVMHYGGMPVELTGLQTFADARGIAIIEDAAHGFGVRTDSGSLGTQGRFGTFSFHATKNVQSGEGGALVVNSADDVVAAEIMREKGTNRSQFLRGAVDKYTWVNRGSSYLPSEYTAAVLDAQLGAFQHIQQLRHAVWSYYAAELADWADRFGIELMAPPNGIHAAHLFYLLVPEWSDQTSLIEHTRSRGVISTFHYQPLHSSPAGQRFGRTDGALPHTDAIARRLVRLPLWAGLTTNQLERVVDSVQSWVPKGTIS
ncbi:MAG: dTDP-4-amino-4,6-dideoxygalactose transaminase [Microbacteriaceae bacterium]